MSLNFSLINNEGIPENILHIEPNEHVRLLNIAKSKSCRTLLKIQDYYSNTVFPERDLGVLLFEIEAILPVCASDKNLSLFLSMFKNVVKFARCKSKTVYVTSH